MGVSREVAEVLHCRFGCIVQVCRAAQSRRWVPERSNEVGEVVAVVAHLNQWVGDTAATILLDCYEVLAAFEAVGLTPLFELDHDIRRASGARVDASEDSVHSLAGQRKLVLDQHLHVV